MNKYDNYNPEIFYGEENITPESGRPLPSDGSSQENHKEKKTVKKRKKPVPAQSKSVNNEPWTKNIVNWFESGNLRLILGIILGGLGIYFAIAFISYLSECFKDQAIINNTPLGAAKGVNNAGGEGGARLSELLINECFGIGSFVIVLWLLAFSCKLLLKRPKFKSVNFTIKCIVALVTVSLIVGLMTISLNSTVNWGGYHGRYVNQEIIDFIGMSGAVILCIVLICIFIVICLRDIIVWINKIRKKRKDRKRAIAEERARRLEEERVIEEMRLREHQEDLQLDDAYNLEDSNPQQNAEDNVVNFDPNDNMGLYEDVEPDESSPAFRKKNESEAMSAVTTEEEDSDELARRLLSNLDDESAFGTYAEPLEPEAATPGSDNVDQNIADDTYAVSTAGTIDSDYNDDSTTDEKDNTHVEAAEENSDDALSQGAKADAPATEEGDILEVNVNEISQVANPQRQVMSSDKMSALYKFPPIEILRPSDDRISVDADELQENQEKIKKTLSDFDVAITSIKATVGPTVTLYEIRPDKGQKVNKIKGLADDISLQLSATGVRIIAPIPGKGTVGIEVANRDAKTVSMRKIIQSTKYQESKCILPVALGSTISNDVYIADLTKMPHMLVAGATGQGKSVGLNVLIASLLYRKKPHELKFVMIDPKMVEFSQYAKIERHYLAKLPGEEKAIITDMSKAVATLNSLVQEMEDRYSLLMKTGVRNIVEYNTKWNNGQLSGKEGHRFLPYIVVIIDEFCDLIMTAGKEVEKPIARLAQKARAVGIHEIVATQRPSTTVITGNIKANFLTRVEFKTSSGIDSKTILDTVGAQQLIGRGDMLISNNSEMTRVQCAFIDTPEVEALTDYISRQPYGSGAYLLPEPQFDAEGNSFSGASGGGDTGRKDPLFVEIGRYVLTTGYASTSALQRKFEIGYNRAGKIMDQLEAVGIVSASMGGKPRNILVSPQEGDEILRQFE